MFNSLWLHEACQVPLPMELSRQEYLSGCHFLLQGIFPTQGLNLGLLHCRWILYDLSHIVNISQKHWKLFSVKKENLIPTQLPKATIWFLYFGFFFFLAMLHRIWESSFQPGIEPMPLAVKAWSLNHWTARKVLRPPFVSAYFSSQTLSATTHTHIYACRDAF